MKQKKPANTPAPLLFTMAEVMELLKYKSRQAVYDLLRRDETLPARAVPPPVIWCG